MPCRLWRRLHRWLFPAAAVLLLSLAPAVHAATITGTVVAREGSRLRPVFRAEVIAREVGSAEIAAVARTDTDGRFTITGLSPPKASLSVQKSRYFTARANGREVESITLDCSAPADCSDIRFELGLGGVVSGMVRDELGEPAAMVMVWAGSPDDEEQERGRPPRGRPVRTVTDDRGYFRLFGLKPGSYVLRAERPVRGPMRNMGFGGDPVEIEVEEGGEIHGILIAGRRSDATERFTVSGKVSGVSSRENDRGFISAEFLRPGSMWGNFTMRTSVDPEGFFTFSGLSPGRYAFKYAVGRGGGASWSSEAAVPLGIVEVRNNVAGLVLEPLRPTGFSGVLKFEALNGPPEIQVRVSSSENWRPFIAVAKAPDYRFEITNLMPGTYHLEVGRNRRVPFRNRAADDFFVRGMRRGTEIVPARDIPLAEGRVEQVELMVSNEFSRIYGRVKAAVEEGGVIRKGAQFQVGLSGPGGFRAVQADQNGRFEFDQVVPGEYRICAWSGLDEQAVYDEKTWAAAGQAVRTFEVEAGSEVEIDLTAAP